MSKMKVTADRLRQGGACGEAVEEFRELFPEGAEVNERNLDKARELLRENVWWVAENAYKIGLTAEPICGAYWSQRNLIYDAYRVQRKPIDDAYWAQRVGLLIRLILEHQK